MLTSDHINRVRNKSPTVAEVAAFVAGDLLLSFIGKTNPGWRIRSSVTIGSSI
jgi:hypothetical protein